MTQQINMQSNVRELPNASLILTLSIISIVTGCIMVLAFIGIVLAVIALILGDKTQNVYLTNPVPSAWNNYSTFSNGMVCAVIGFIICAFICSIGIGFGLYSMQAGFK